MKLSRLVSLTFIIAGLSLWTLAPYGGCGCSNPLGPNDGPTPTPTPTHGPKIDDFDGADVLPATHVNAWHGVFEPSVDTMGVSSMNVAIGPPGFDGTGNALHFSGVFGRATAAPPYPFVSERIYLTNAGKLGSENALAYGTTGLRFRAMRGSAANPLIVKLILKSLSDYTEAHTSNANAYHYHSKAVTLGTSWALQTIPFSQFAWGGSWGGDAIGATYNNSNLSQAVCQPGGALQVMAIQLEPQNPTAFPGSASFDFYIDQLEFY